MSGGTGYHNRGSVIGGKIHDLIFSLNSSTYDETSPKIGFWIEHALTEQSINAADLVERLSSIPWNGCSSTVARFLKEFRDAPHSSQQARSFVDKLCSHILRWFAAGSAENLTTSSIDQHRTYEVAVGGGNGFLRLASFVGSLVGQGLFGHELVRRHLVKPLIAHHYTDRDDAERSVRAIAIYYLLAAAGNTLVQGLLDPSDVQACFKALDTKISLEGLSSCGPDATRINELRELHASWLKRKDKERIDALLRLPLICTTGAAKAPAEAETPLASAPKYFPIAVNIGIPSISRGIESYPVLFNVESFPEASTDDPVGTMSSPTLSISTISDLTPTELGEDTGEDNGERIPTRHEMFYLEDGNVEIVCGHTIFRVHSPIVSFSSPKFRDALSPSTLLNAPMPDGCPRVVFEDGAEDFAVLLKMIYTPGFPERHEAPKFSVFASLLRMTAKYGFSNVRDQLVKDIKGAYPTKWETYQAAEVLGEDVFGSPKPHPNAVLNLFLEQNVKFALPFAAYRAGLGGPSALISNKPGMALPRLALVSVTHGIGAMRRAMIIAAYRIVYIGSLGVCAGRTCVLNVGIDHMERRMKALENIFDVMAGRSEGDMLSPLSLGTLACVDCAERLEKAHVGCRERFVWAALPNLLGWESWEGA